MPSTPEFSSDTERGEHVSLRTPRGDSSEAFRSLRNALLLLSHILILSVFATITRALPMLSKAFFGLTSQAFIVFVLSSNKFWGRKTETRVGLSPIFTVISTH